jgi:hypothetical protein
MGQYTANVYLETRQSFILLILLNLVYGTYVSKFSDERRGLIVCFLSLLAAFAIFTGGGSVTGAGVEKFLPRKNPANILFLFSTITDSR